MRRKQFRPNSEWVRYRDGTWIECRKRIYLYWYKFLRHAEESSEHKVNWKKYDSWGGKNGGVAETFNHTSKEMCGGDVASETFNHMYTIIDYEVFSVTTKIH